MLVMLLTLLKIKKYAFIDKKQNLISNTDL